jgi:hypothetical protein
MLTFGFTDNDFTPNEDPGSKIIFQITSGLAKLIIIVLSWEPKGGPLMPSVQRVKFFVADMI